ncbi:GLIPR1-like protein 1 [Molossus molossus]|uniref:GLIPR1 like 1 n=1 Tax=Molossus molossus TaxID=27622 RepID=A0A7J8FYE6_MOLMO|nr:GLIPR1-like protein 1 [Molossus molossus]KAF6452419.1 GLIPR1 like 1 [Molossus molossus]
MVLWNKLSCLWTLGFCLVTSKRFSVPSIKDKSFIDQCVDAHNELRRQVQPPAANMKYMSWDEGLAKISKAWANQCQMEHNHCLSNSYHCHPIFISMGENIWLGDSYNLTPKSVINHWYNESIFYNFNRLQCSKICTHYTQVIWANSYKVGCAINICPDLGGTETAIFICDYGPPGNYERTPPYTKGVPCSKCGKEDSCENKLCRNKERDTLIEYPNWNPHGKAAQQTACNLLCLVCVLLRLF